LSVEKATVNLYTHPLAALDETLQKRSENIQPVHLYFPRQFRCPLRNNSGDFSKQFRCLLSKQFRYALGSGSGELSKTVHKHSPKQFRCAYEKNLEIHSRIKLGNT
jgi:hypothetical protein